MQLEMALEEAQPESSATSAELAERLLDELVIAHPMKRRVNLEWRRYRTTAGTANFETNTIALSTLVLDSDEKLTSTLIHEFAHLLCYDRHGRNGRGHGENWRRIMVELGQKPEVHHRYEVKRNQARQMCMYRCAKCGAELLRRRKLSRWRRYYHVNCGGLVRFQGVFSLAGS